MKTSMLLLSILFLLDASSSYAQLNISKDKNNSYSCSSCHGEKGISPNEEWPNLAGQKKKYIMEQLKKFKKGERTNALMSPMAAMLTESEMESLAEYFSKLSAQ